MRAFLRGCLKFLFGIVLFITIVTILGTFGRRLREMNERSLTPEQRAARSEAAEREARDQERFHIWWTGRELVRSKLQAPSTAKFSGPYAQESGLSSDSNYWSATGWVEAQNAFGVPLRQGWFVRFEKTPSNAIPIYATIGDQEVYATWNEMRRLAHEMDANKLKPQAPSLE